MKINFASMIPFSSLEMYKANNLNFPKDFSCRAKDNNRTFYTVSINENKPLGCYEIHYRDDSHLDPVAEQELMIWPEIDYIYVDNMFTDEDKRGAGLGTCMHLTNIIEMLENDVKRIELLSASSAIPFHIRYGFKPNDKWEKLRANIRKIAEDETPELKRYSDEAQAILKTTMSPDLKSKFANNLLNNYTKKAIKIKSKEKQEYLFDQCINMRLTREDVLKNKDFYNKLFDKYNIDYQI